ncbi:MAG: MBL fold metallo-hydrolase, partial [Bacteroidales bacterium]|nr:MBL fold metallo-hydrolase [Bacteroidales bacterium]
MIIGSILLLAIAIILVLTILSLIAAPFVLHLPQFGRNPSGARLERIRKSPNYLKDKFVNRTLEGQKDITLKQYLKIARKFIFGKRRRITPPQPLEMVKRDLKHLDNGKNLYVWFGHSSYLLSLHGTTILTDPTLCCGSPFTFINKPFPGTSLYSPEEMPDSIDFVIITHDHYDHLDYNTILRLKERTVRFVCPLGVGAHLEHWGVAPEKIIEMDWEESFSPKPGWEI